MKSENRDLIREAFSGQAEGFESKSMNFSKQAYLDAIVSRLGLNGRETVLEAAAGTCACGRAIAPHAAHVTCLDWTPAMLEVGRAEAKKRGLANMGFVLGDAAELPFLDDSFDVVISRLAFHHFPQIRPPFEQMKRVLKPDGKLVLIDMEAAPEELRGTEDEIERMRDPSHVRNLSREEMLALYRENGLTVTLCDEIPTRQVLNSWMALTHTPEAVQKQIVSRMEAELAGGKKTGFFPKMRGGEIGFDHIWLMLVGEKRA